MRMRTDLILVFGLSVSLAGIAAATEQAQPSAAVPPVPAAQEAAAPVHSPAASAVVAPAAPAAAAAPAATAAPAAPAVPAATVAAADAAADEDPMVCKKITETGTLGRRKKLCMTASQWDEQRKAARGVMGRIDSGAGAQGPAGTPGAAGGGG